MCDLWYAAWQCRLRPRQTDTHRVAHADFDLYVVLLAEFEQLGRQRQYEAVEVCSGYIFEVASGQDPGVQGSFDCIKIHIKHLRSALAQLQEDMIVRTTGQNTCLGEPHVLDQLEVAFYGSDPARDLRKLISPLHTFADDLPVTF